MSFTPPAIAPLDPALAERLRVRIAGQARPPGALGRLEALAVQIGAIQASEQPRMERIAAYVFAGDHGLNASGVSAYPSAVTAAMVATFLAGRASVNALARACGVDVKVVDAGVDADLPPHAELIDAKVRRGTRNAAVEAAMSSDEGDQRAAARRRSRQRGGGARLRRTDPGRDGHRQHGLLRPAHAPARACAAGALHRARRGA